MTLPSRSKNTWLVLLVLLFIGIAARFTYRSLAPFGKGSRRAPVPTLTVFAAASTANALQEIGQAYGRAHPVRMRFNFASSGTLARQMEAGARIDLFISADEQWMDYAAGRGLVAPESRRDLLGNRLVLIAPAGKPLRARMDRSFDLARALNGRLAIGDPESAPAGRYAKDALAALHWNNGLRLLPCADVRAILATVERGEVSAGIVYASDAAITEKVTVIGEFPESTHQPIRYPAALGRQADPEAAAFMAYLSGPEAQQIFTRYGFTIPK